MNNREWIQQVLAHCQPEAVPFNCSFSPPARQRVEEHYGAPAEVALDFPIRMTGLTTIKPLYASPEEFGDLAKDEFGVEWSTSSIDRGTPHSVLPDPALTGYTFPEASAAYRFEDMADWCKANAGNYTIVWVGDLWERAAFMRGMDNILMDLVIHPAFVRSLLRRLADYILATMEILFARCRFDGIAVSDDYGAQNAMLMSPAHWREFIKPLLTEIYSLARKHNRNVFHHSCGHIRPIIPDLIDIGLDILDPIQPEAMDIHALKAEFGKALTFCGGIPTQSLLPNGTPQEVRDEIKRLKDKMGRGGGYILAPGITLQADVPRQNLLALINAALSVV